MAIKWIGGFPGDFKTFHILLTNFPSQIEQRKIPCNTKTTQLQTLQRNKLKG